MKFLTQEPDPGNAGVGMRVALYFSAPFLPGLQGDPMKHLLSIAGSDCSGGAGIQADLKAFSACGTYGMSVITALTAQNTQGVQTIFDVPPDFVRAQLDAIFNDIIVDGVKIGMLSSPGILEVVADFLKTHRIPILVVDPVMVSKSGHSLLHPEAVDALIRLLLPLADLITPNIPEAEVLANVKIQSLQDMELAAHRILELGARAVLVKGGHRDAAPTDVLVTAEKTLHYSGQRLSQKHTHGTGCSLSSACTAFWAISGNLDESVGKAKDYVATGIYHGLNIGHGTGPIHHFQDLYQKAGYST